MCRMVGMVSTSKVVTESGAAGVAPLPPLSGEETVNRKTFATTPGTLPSWQHLVGAPNSLRVQAETGAVPENSESGHDDSWGIGWFDGDKQVSLLRQTGSAAQSAFYVFAAEGAARGGAGSGAAQTLIGHLRKASCGVVNSENSHPVRVDYRTQENGGGGYNTLMVAHNGTIRAPLFATLQADVAQAGRAEARSDSDTVMLAGWLASRFTDADTDDAFTILEQSLRELFVRAAQVEGGDTRAYSGVNLLIAHPDGLYALRQFSSEGNYYTLYVRPLQQAEDGTDGWIVASEKTDVHPSWELLTPGVVTLFPANTDRPVRTATVASQVENLD